MLTALFRALRDIFAPEQRRALLLSVAYALVLLAVLWGGTTILVARLHLSRIGWVDEVIDLLGSVAALFIAWSLFPAMTMLTFGFFTDRVLRSLERVHYPALPEPRGVGAGEAIVSGLRLGALAIVLNLLALPLYLVPGANLVLYYGINGYLAGRMYFETVALRRMEPGRVRALWRWRRGAFVLAGIFIAFLLSVPIVNLAAPLIAVAFMLHLFEDTRRRAPAEINPREA